MSEHALISRSKVVLSQEMLCVAYTIPSEQRSTLLYQNIAFDFNLSLFLFYRIVSEVLLSFVEELGMFEINIHVHLYQSGI